MKIPLAQELDVRPQSRSFAYFAQLNTPTLNSPLYSFQVAAVAPWVFADCALWGEDLTVDPLGYKAQISGARVMF